MEWMGWPLQRMLLFFVGIAFLLIFVQVTLFHYRQNFRHWSMWIPVLATPVIGTLSLYLGLYNLLWLRILLAILLVTGVGVGMLGSYLHVKGVGERVGGYAMRNFLTGPPMTLPSMVTGMSLLGLLALFWG